MNAVAVAVLPKASYCDSRFPEVRATLRPRTFVALSLLYDSHPLKLGHKTQKATLGYYCLATVAGLEEIASHTATALVSQHRQPES